MEDHDGKVDANNLNPDLETLVNDIRNFITSDIVIYAPPSLSYKQATKAVGECELMKVYVNSKHDRNFIFLGTLKDQVGITTVQL